MSLTNGKKEQSKEELRLLMKTQKGALNGQGRIDSPLAKYNSLGQLSCIVCSCPLKSDLLWNAHILGKVHKENVARYKTQALQKPSSVESKSVPLQSSSLKRKSSGQDVVQANEKKLRKLSDASAEASRSAASDRSQPSVAGSSISTSSSSSSSSASAKVTGIVHGVSSTTADQGDDESDMEVDILPPNKISGSSSSLVSSSKEDASVEKTAPVSSAGLPEGFIDDPVLDAKVRNVPYKDKMEEQLELFQREMKQQETVSENLAAEDDEQRLKERQMYEVEERMHNFSRVLQAVRMKEELQAPCSAVSQSLEIDNGNNNNSDDDDETDDDDPDWRAKMVLKK